MKRILIATLVLLTCSPAFGDFDGKSADIRGVKLGMSLAEAKSAIQKAYPKMVFDSLWMFPRNVKINQTPANANGFIGVYKYTYSKFNYLTSDVVKVVATGDKSYVWQVSRSGHLGDVTRDAFEKQLIAKYGEPLIKWGNTPEESNKLIHAGNTVALPNGPAFIWALAADGHKLESNNFNNPCKDVGEISVNKQCAFLLKIIYTMDRYTPEIVESYSSILIEPPAGFKFLSGVDSDVKAKEKSERQQQLDTGAKKKVDL